MNKAIKLASTQPPSFEPAVAVIGFGPAGFNAVLAMRQSGYSGPIRVFSDTDTIPYSPILTSYYVAGLKEYEECFPWDIEQIEELSLDLRMGFPVERLDTKEKTVITSEGAFPYTKCVIATGATPMTVGFPRNCGYEPYVLRTMEDAQRLKQAISNPGCSRVLVSGASMVALKVLEAFLVKNLDVTLVGMNPHVLDFSALPEAAARFEKGLEAKGVSLRLGQTINDVSVIEDDAHSLGRKLRVEFSNGEEEEFDEIAVAHGMGCNLGFLEEGALDIDKALLVDDRMRTSDPDVYAAGDVAQAFELISGEKRIVGIWKTAVEQGKCAGRTIASELSSESCGMMEPYKGSLPANTISVDGTLFISAGTMDLSGDRFKELQEGPDMTVVYVYEPASDCEACGKRLVGFNIACDYDEEGGFAYDLGAMLTMRILEGCGA